jgi:hypothetical protein
VNAEKPGLSATRLERYRQRLLTIARGTGEFAEPYRQALRWLEEDERLGLCWAPDGKRRCRKPEGHDPGWHDDGLAAWPDDTNRCAAQAAGLSCRLAAGHAGQHKGPMRGLTMADRAVQATASWSDSDGVPFLSIDVQVPSVLAGESALAAAGSPEPEEARGPYCGAEKPSVMREGYRYRCVRFRGHEGPHNSGDGQWEDHPEDPPLPACPVGWCSLPLGHTGGHTNIRGEDQA